LAALEANRPIQARASAQLTARQRRFYLDPLFPSRSKLYGYGTPIRFIGFRVRAAPFFRVTGRWRNPRRVLIHHPSARYAESFNKRLFGIAYCTVRLLVWTPLAFPCSPGLTAMSCQSARLIAQSARTITKYISRNCVRKSEKERNDSSCKIKPWKCETQNVSRDLF